jgi:hypothetical protein
MDLIGIAEGVGVVAALTWGLSLFRRIGDRPPLPVKRRRIAALDLTPVREKVMKRHGWDDTQTRANEADYRDFLMLLAENDGRTISPWTDDLDLFWHEHILDTQKYAKDCAWIFGRFIQHDPHIGMRPYHHEETKRTTMALREAQLKAREERRAAAKAAATATDAGDGFDVVTWGCSAETGSSHGTTGHSCGGHGGGDHSAGGHSCGGHSCGGGHGCGGHGCGGGCGGGGH